MGDVQRILEDAATALDAAAEVIRLLRQKHDAAARCEGHARNLRSLAARGAVPEGWRDFLDWCAANVIASSGRAVFNDQEGFRRRLHAMLAAAPPPAGEAKKDRLPKALCDWLSERGLLPDVDEDGGVDVDGLIEMLNTHEGELVRTPQPAVEDEPLQACGGDLARCVEHRGPCDACRPPVSPEPATSAPHPINSNHWKKSNGCVDSSGPADVEALADFARAEYERQREFGATDEQAWHAAFEAAARRLSGARQAAFITGDLVEIGDDHEGQPRLVIHTTREAIAACRASLLFKPVVVQAAKDGAE